MVSYLTVSDGPKATSYSGFQTLAFMHLLTYKHIDILTKENQTAVSEYAGTLKTVMNQCVTGTEVTEMNKLL